MLVQQFGSVAVRINEQSVASRGDFVAFTGWVKNTPHLFITRSGGRPLDVPTAAISQQQMIDFTTPGTLSSLYRGDAPLDPRLCAVRCVEVANALHLGAADDFQITQILDLVQDCFDVMHHLPNYLMVDARDARTDIGDFQIKVNGAVLQEGEARL